MKRTRVLVTGASGRIGTELLKILSADTFELHAVSSSNGVNFAKNVNHVYFDRNLQDFSRLPEVDVIFHLSAQTSAYTARKDVSKDIESNLLSTVRMLEKVSKFMKPPVLIHAGSITQYGVKEQLSLNEKAKVIPETFYDASKTATELYLKQYLNEGVISNFISLRLPNVYGSSREGAKSDRGFLDQTIQKAITGEVIKLYGDGKYVRDYLHVSDAAQAFLEAFIWEKNLSQNFYNIGTGIGTTILDCVKIICEKSKMLTGKESNLKFEEFPEHSYPIERRNSVSDSSEFRNKTSWRHKIALEIGIQCEIQEAIQNLQ
jgi:nucleoside-diphosphate-sugar epimerase